MRCVRQRAGMPHVNISICSSDGALVCARSTAEGSEAMTEASMETGVQPKVDKRLLHQTAADTLMGSCCAGSGIPSP